MESGSSFGNGLSEKSSDFAFAFNDVNFSDRVLRIEILLDVTGSKPGPDDSLADWARNRKRRRDDQLNGINFEFLFYIVASLNIFRFYGYVRVS